MGFEDGVEHSFGRPCRQTDGKAQADIRSHLIHISVALDHATFENLR
jgi:hypothetical protein